MEYIRVTKDNLEQEHICCAISNNKDVQVSSKKAWLADRFDDGLVFLKSVERGKCFIEYIPAENAWNPILAENYMYIDCLWVSGSFKGHGYSNDLLEECIKDSKDKGKTGLCILSSAKKRPFLSDPKYLAHKGYVKTEDFWPTVWETRYQIPIGTVLPGFVLEAVAKFEAANPQKKLFALSIVEKWDGKFYGLTFGNEQDYTTIFVKFE